MGGRTRNECETQESRCRKKANAPFLMEQMPVPCPSFFLYKPKKGSVAVVQMSPILKNSAFGPVLIGRDMKKSRWFSKSKSVCAGWSGKVPRYCAIWTPQCGGMKGKLCFIKRKSKDLVSNGRRFYEKNVSVFENGEKSNKNLWVFLRNVPSFLFFLPAFLKRRPFLHLPCHALFPHPHLRTRERTRPCASRTQRVRNSCLHPSPPPTIR